MVSRELVEIQIHNATILSNIRRLCAMNGTSITKLEKELGYGNGSVSGWKNAKKVLKKRKMILIIFTVML